MEAILWTVIVTLFACTQGTYGSNYPGNKIGLVVPVDSSFTCKATRYRYLNLSKSVDDSRTYEERMKIKYEIGSTNVHFDEYTRFLIGPGVGLASAVHELPLNMMFSSYAIGLSHQSLFRMPSGGLYMNKGAQIYVNYQSEMVIKGSYLYMKSGSELSIDRGDTTMKGVRAIMEEDSRIYASLRSNLLLSHGDRYTTETGTSVGLIMKQQSKLDIHLSSFVNIEDGPNAGLFMGLGSKLELWDQSKVSGGELVLMDKSKVFLKEQADIEIPRNGVLLVFPNVSVTLDGGEIIMGHNKNSETDKKLFCFIFKDLDLRDTIDINTGTTEDSIICTNDPTDHYLKPLLNELDNQQGEGLKAAVGRLVTNLAPFEVSFKDIEIPTAKEWGSCST